MNKHFDLVVIGSGPGGEGASMQAAKAGRKVLVIERYALVGGGCTHWGTIPSKALRHAIQELTEFRRSRLFADHLPYLGLGVPELLSSASSVIHRQVDMRQSFYERNHVEVLHGEASFVDEHTLSVDLPDGSRSQVSSDFFVIATGSRPYRPPEIDFEHPCVFDADTILKLDRTPHSMLVYGAGVIGCEYASMFRNLGVKVDLINTRHQLLAYLDDEIVDALAYHLRSQGVLVRHNESCERVEADGDDAVIVHFSSGKQIRCDALLWANGRTGNSEALTLDRVGLDVDRRGNLSVNAHMQTARAHIYAVGDIAGPPALASAAYDQGRFAARHMLDPDSDRRLVEGMPTGIYTSPEISCIGRNERELTEAKVPYEVGRSMFSSLARAQITGQSTGMLKLLFHRETLEILGIHCFGNQAAEIIHIGQAIMAQPGRANSLEYFVNTTFNYPTMAEAYRVAALNGLNRLF